MTEEHLYSIALRRCNLIGDINFFKLVRTTGSAKEAWFLSKKNLQRIDGFGRRIPLDIGNEEHLRFAEKEIAFCQKNDITILLRHLNDFPELLNECEDAPAILYLKGNLHKDSKKLSMVGTRNMTPYGKDFIKDFFEASKKQKFVSVSGLALGTDSEVHLKSLECKIPTIAVLAHGLHTIYPSKNKTLSEKILEENGALITEFNSSHKPDREHFIQRNRIIAGLSSSTIVVETAFGGGSISTVTFANAYNRDVYALPGKITDKQSQGCNLVISQNKAHTISTIKTLLEQIDLQQTNTKLEELFPRSEVRKALTEEQEMVYNIIKKSPKISLDEMGTYLDMASHQLHHILLDLELSGLVKSLSGKQYIAV